LEFYKNRRKANFNTSPPIRKYSTPPGPWAKIDKEKADYLLSIFQRFSLLITTVQTKKLIMN
jgi:hypothetical protein